MIPHGERLHNPFNLEKGIEWQGLVNLSFDHVFCEFETDLMGLRAGFINLKTQLNKGFNTLEKLIYKYAPPKTATNPNENNTEAYIAAVSKRTGLARKDIIRPSDLKRLGEAIIIQEQGRLSYDDGLIDQALALAGVQIYELPSDTGKPSLFKRLCNYVLPTKLA